MLFHGFENPRVIISDNLQYMCCSHWKLGTRLNLKLDGLLEEKFENDRLYV